MRYLLLIAAVCCVIVPVNGQQTTTKPKKDEKPAANANTPKQTTVNVDTVNVDKLNVAKQTNAADQTNKDAEKPPSYFRRLVAPENLPNLVLCLIGVAGVIAAVFTLRAINRQTDATEKAVEEARRSGETAQRQLRAYISLHSAAVVFPQPAVPEAQITFRNSGQTPAYNVRGWIHTWFAPYPLQETLPIAPDDLRKGSETLAAGRDTIFVAPTKGPLQPPYLAILGTKQFTMFVYGRIEYRDAFGKNQFTNFRLILGGNEGIRTMKDKNGVEQRLLNPDAEGNETS